MDHDEYDHHHAMLAERAPHAKCPICGNGSWERTAVVDIVLDERVLVPKDPDQDATETVQHRRPAVALTCDQCWFVRVHLTMSPYAHLGE